MVERGRRDLIQGAPGLSGEGRADALEVEACEAQEDRMHRRHKHTHFDPAHASNTPRMPFRGRRGENCRAIVPASLKASSSGSSMGSVGRSNGRVGACVSMCVVLGGEGKVTAPNVVLPLGVLGRGLGVLLPDAEVLCTTHTRALNVGDTLVGFRRRTW